MPVKIEEIINEGKYSRRRTYDIYQDQGYGIVNNIDTIRFEKDIHSPYSLLYFFRKPNFNLFKSKEINILKKKSFETLIIDTEKSVKINSKYGSWFATRVTPKRAKNDKFKNNSIISIWFTEDEKRHPVKFWIKMKYGALLLELYESE